MILKFMKSFLTHHFLLLLLLQLKYSDGQDNKYRPEFHFSIASAWINDPNGMVWIDGEYHLFYQYNPDDSVWGPMHWGHSFSTDLTTWTDLPIALYPDELGGIFSGSAVIDLANTTGFQRDEIPPMVAIFTHAGASQQQSIAYSLDKGRTFTKYEGNPVIPNPGINDFRDPKVFWYSMGNKWVLLLAAGNKIMFYSSTDLKSWEYMSEFGENPEQGSHDGVWECPDLVIAGDGSVWILLVSINPGGPNGGSATQYFLGGFDGNSFSSSQIEPLWMDHGVDNYAAVSFSNEPLGRSVVMGWMNNWDYANNIPTNGWRGQMTLPRSLDLVPVNGGRLTSNVVPEVKMKLFKNDTHEVTPNLVVGPDEVLSISILGDNNSLIYSEFTFTTRGMGIGSSLAICMLNRLGQEVCTGFDKGRELPVFLNREISGNTDFHPGFARRITANREKSVNEDIKFEIYWDVSAVEVYVDGGLTCMTALFYPDEPYIFFEIRHHASGNPGSLLQIVSGQVRGLKSMSEVKNKYIMS